jgi:hypothetical protein
MMQKLTPNQVGKIGETWVLYKLSRMGINAVLAPENTDAVDILAATTEGVPFAIQVKTRTDATRWPLKKKHEHIRDPRLFYALVDLGKRLDKELPDTFIVPSDVIATVSRVQFEAWIANTPEGRSRNPNTEDRDIRESYSRNRYGEVEGCPDGWMEKYRENWSLLPAEPEGLI